MSAMYMKSDTVEIEPGYGRTIRHKGKKYRMPTEFTHFAGQLMGAERRVSIAEHAPSARAKRRRRHMQES